MYHLPALATPDFLAEPSLKEAYRGRKVLVLGGDGFLGSHVATGLLRLGADVSVLSRRVASVLEGTRIRIHHGHLLQREVLSQALSDQEIVFDFAGSSGAVDSNRDPRRNLAEECEPHLNAFQIAAALPRPPLLVFCSTRTVYGKARQLPVSEANPLAPESAYAIHKVTLEHYLQAFGGSRNLPYLIFRLSNPYGPQTDPEIKTYGILNQFILKALRAEPIRLFGDGSQRRDYIHIDDVVEAFLRAAVEPSCRNEIFNLGGPSPISMREAVDVLLEECPGSPVIHEAWPTDYHAVETGDYFTDLTKLVRHLPRTPAITFRDGIRRTLAAYRALDCAGVPALRRTPITGNERPQYSSAPEASWKWRGKRVLVTGATGFLGRVLVNRLLELEATVGAVHRKPLDPALTVNPRLYSLQLSLEDSESLHREVGHFQPEVIFHLASRPDGPELPNHPVSCVQANVLSTVNLLELGRAHAVSAFVMAGSSKIYGNSPVPHREDSAHDPQSSYAASKLAAWNYCRVFSRLHNLPVVALHPTLIYGPAPGANLFTFLTKCLLSGKALIELDGGMQTRDPLYLDDAIEAYLRAAEQARQLHGRALPIGGGREYTVKELAERFIQAADHRTPVRACGERIRATEMMRSYCDNVDAWSALRWQPSVPLMEGLRMTASYLLGAR